MQLLAAAIIAASLGYNYHADNQRRLVIWRAGNRWMIDLNTEIQRSDSDTESPINNHANSSYYSNTIAAELQAIDFFSRWLVILTLHTESGHNRKFVIPCDSLSTNNFRLLRVRLRVEGFGLLNPDRKT